MPRCECTLAGSPSRRGRAPRRAEYQDACAAPGLSSWTMRQPAQAVAAPLLFALDRSGLPGVHVYSPASRPAGSLRSTRHAGSATASPADPPWRARGSMVGPTRRRRRATCRRLWRRLSVDATRLLPSGAAATTPRRPTGSPTLGRSSASPVVGDVELRSQGRPGLGENLDSPFPSSDGSGVVRWATRCSCRVVLPRRARTSPRRDRARDPAPAVARSMIAC